MERLRKFVAVLPLVVVVVAPAAASWTGLTSVGRDWFGLPGVWSLLVPLSADAAAAYCATLARRAVLVGDSAVADRLLLWLYAAGSAGLNVWHANSAPAALFFGAASISAVTLWDRTLRAWRRDALRAAGAIERALPRFRASRWLVAPMETGRALRTAIVHGLTSPDEALTVVRERYTFAPAALRSDAPAEPVALAGRPSPRVDEHEVPEQEQTQDLRAELPELHELPELRDLPGMVELPEIAEPPEASELAVRESPWWSDAQARELLIARINELEAEGYQFVTVSDVAPAVEAARSVGWVRGELENGLDGRMDAVAGVQDGFEIVTAGAEPTLEPAALEVVAAVLTQPTQPIAVPVFQAAPRESGDAGGLEVVERDGEPRPDRWDDLLSRTSTKREALDVAWAALGVEGVPQTSQVRPAVEWLAERGITCNVSGAYAARRELEQTDTAAPARLELLAGGSR